MAEHCLPVPIGGNVRQPVESNSATPRHLRGPFVELVVAAPSRGKDAANRITERQAKRRRMPSLARVDPQRPPRGQRRCRQGKEAVGIDGKEQAPAPGPLAERTPGQSDYLTADDRAGPRQQLPQIDHEGGRDTARQARPLQGCRSQRRISWLKPGGVASLKPASSAARREATLALRICAKILSSPLANAALR